MQPEQQLISDLTVFSKYARYWEELERRETFEEIVARNRQMHLDHIAGKENEAALVPLIDEAYRMVRERKLFPSMRSLQFGGDAILKNNARVYNCAFRYADDVEFFQELMYLLLCGTGVGFSVQKHHVAEMPLIAHPYGSYAHVIDDSIEGWAGAVGALFEAYMTGAPSPVFDYSLIRPKGALLKTSGGRAPGPEPLRKTLEDLDSMLRRRLDDADRLGAYLNEPGRRGWYRLKPIDVHDMATVIARAVLSGGIRRSAMISLFSPDDEDMLGAKSGSWWVSHPERAYANNSAVLVRGRDDDLFHEVFARARASGSGEPGIYWVDDPKYGTNPCAEITLNHKQFCNLTTINAGTIKDQNDFNSRARGAAIIGTFQASYTNFPFLSEGWAVQTQEEALLGVSMTGIASGAIDHLDANEAASHAVAANHEVAELLGINPAARVTTVKPEGTASLVAGTSSGIHAWHDTHYIRRMRFNRDEPIAKYLLERFPEGETDILHADKMSEHQIVVSIPQAAPEGAATRDEGAMALLERVKRYNREWITPGNTYGGMRNNISATINVREDEWDAVHDWMWNNRYEYNGLSLLPHSDHTYVQAPFEATTPEVFEVMSRAIAAAGIDLRMVQEFDDNTVLSAELACAGGACEWTP